MEFSFAKAISSLKESESYRNNPNRFSDFITEAENGKDGGNSIFERVLKKRLEAHDAKYARVFEELGKRHARDLADLEKRHRDSGNRSVWKF